MSSVFDLLGEAGRMVRMCQLRRGHGEFKEWAALMIALPVMALVGMSCAHVKKGPFDLGGAIQLGELQTGRSEFALKHPSGSKYCRLIVVCPKPAADALRSSLRGKLEVKRDGGKVLEIGLSPEALSACTWFADGLSVSGYHLHWPKVLDESLQRSGKYTVEIEMQGKPPAKSTVWLFYFPWHYGVF